MADIELVVKIPEDEYELCKKYNGHLGDNRMIADAIAKGTPLPKGHGRLVDANDVTDFEGHYIITDAPTIIEADKENE